MPRFFPKKFNGKMAEPMIPFFAAGIIVAYGINAMAGAMYDSDEFRMDPRNPNFEKNRAAAGAQKQ